MLTADTYGAGDADRLLGSALGGVPREDYCLVGAVGHDFYEGERDGPRGFPRFTDPRLRGPDGYADYLRMATEASLERCGADAFDLLLLHNPDRTGYTSEAVWDAMAALRADGLAGAIGVAPGPANGFTLDLIDCLERFGDRIDWAMVILNPLEPWPGEYVLPAAERAGVRVITRVVDYGGLFWGDLEAGFEFPKGDHRGFRPEGWVERGLERIDQMRPVAERHDLTPLQLACQWNLAHPAVACCAPTLIQEAGEHARPVEDKRAELAATPAARDPVRRRGGRHPRGRRQPRLDAAQGRRRRPRGRGEARPLAAVGRAGRRGRALGHRPRARPGQGRLALQPDRAHRRAGGAPRRRRARDRGHRWPSVRGLRFSRSVTTFELPDADHRQRGPGQRAPAAHQRQPAAAVADDLGAAHAHLHAPLAADLVAALGPVGPGDAALLAVRAPVGGAVGVAGAPGSELVVNCLIRSACWSAYCSM